MDNPSVYRLQILDGTNYLYWQTRLRTHIKSIDVRSWKAFLERYRVPKLPADADGDVVVKLENQWTNND